MRSAEGVDEEEEEEAAAAAKDSEGKNGSKSQNAQSGQGDIAGFEV